MQDVSRDTYQDEVVEASRAQPVLVDFWGPRCGPCIAMMPWVEQLAEDLAPKLKIVKLNSVGNRRLCAELRVMGLPTFVLYRDGQEAWRLSGDVCTPRSIKAALRESLPELSPA